MVGAFNNRGTDMDSIFNGDDVVVAVAAKLYEKCGVPERPRRNEKNVGLRQIKETAEFGLKNGYILSCVVPMTGDSMLCFTKIKAITRV